MDSHPYGDFGRMEIVFFATRVLVNHFDFPHRNLSSWLTGQQVESIRGVASRPSHCLESKSKQGLTLLWTIQEH